MASAARGGKRPLPDSNRGWRICNPLPSDSNLGQNNELQTIKEVACLPLAETPKELARVMTSWFKLPRHVRLAVLALIDAAEAAER